ncbi:MAG: hypothetical protein AAF492_05345 [Verrucomicrobiota bacterium]
MLNRASLQALRRWGHRRNLPGMCGLLLHRALWYLVRRLLPPFRFRFQGKKYAYRIHPFILNNERCVEIPLVMDFVRNRPGADMLEIGNVLSAFQRINAVVVDKYEQAPGVLNEDVVDYRPEQGFDLIVSISTLEHIGWDEIPKAPEKVVRAVDHLKTLLKPGGEVIATVPVGYNSSLDQSLREETLGLDIRGYLQRVSGWNVWREVSPAVALSAAFNAPYACGNAIAVGYWRRPC